MAERVLEGRCHCGIVRYRVRGEPSYVAFCHCIDCRRVAGAPVVVWAGFPDAAFTLLQGDPLRYASSERVERRFCGVCGTPLVYKHREEDTLDVSLATLDDPEALQPECHVYTRSRIGWMHQSDGLPRYPRLKRDGEEKP